jgi:hypothetical protein
VSITSVFEQFKPGFAQVLKELGVELTAHELGADHLSDALSAPAIIWVPIGAAMIKPIAGPMAPTVRRLVRPTVTPGAGEALDTGRIEEPAQYADRHERIEIHVWEKNFPKLEALVNHLVAAMRVGLSGHGFKPVSTDWTVGQDQKSRGYYVCLFNCIIRVPFTFEPMKTAAYPLTLEVEGEILEPDEPFNPFGS